MNSDKPYQVGDVVYIDPAKCLDAGDWETQYLEYLGTEQEIIAIQGNSYLLTTTNVSNYAWHHDELTLVPPDLIFYL